MKFPLNVGLAYLGVAIVSTIVAPPSYANNHSGVRLPSWYITPTSPHITRAQALALTAPTTGTASSTAPSAGSPDPAPTTARLAALQSQYNANPQAFTAAHPQYAALFRDEAAIAAGNTSNITGLVPTTPAWNYLRFRRSLDPARFDAHHPRIGPLLNLDQQIRNLIDKPQLPQVIEPPPPPPAGGSNGGTNPTPPPGPNPLPPSVPEPASVVLFLMGIVGLTWYLVAQERRRALTNRLDEVGVGEINVLSSILPAATSPLNFDVPNRNVEPGTALARA